LTCETIDFITKTTRRRIMNRLADES
jgi:hypothetical protein